MFRSLLVARLGEKALPLYRLTKKSDKFEWTPEADATFAELKALLSTQPVLAAPISKDPLLLYIAPLDKSSVQYLRSSGKKKEKPIKFSAQYIMFLKF